MKSSDFKFYINCGNIAGWVIFPDDSGRKPCGVYYRGKLIASATKYAQTTNLSRGRHNPSFFSIVIKPVGENASYHVKDFLVCEYTGITDNCSDKIYLRDIILDLSTQETFLVKKRDGGTYYLAPLNQDEDCPFEGTKLLTDKGSYTILGNELEGEIDANWQFILESVQ